MIFRSLTFLRQIVYIQRFPPWRMVNIRSWVVSLPVRITLFKSALYSTNSIVIYEPDLIARRNIIHGCLSDVDRLETNLRKRIRRHDALIAHMEIIYSTRRKLWYLSPRIVKEGEGRSGRASLLTKESRNEFVRKGLEQERAAMRLKGASEETAIELG